MLKRILKKCYFQVEKLFYGSGYKKFDIGSKIRKPIRILGKKYIEIGKFVYILDGLRMEAVSKWQEQVYSPMIKIDDHVMIGQYCHFTCANKLEIGRGTSILPNVLITDIEHEYVPNKSISTTGIEVGSVTIGEYVTIGMGARILGHKNIVIGNNCVIGANAVVTHDIPECAIVAGIPAKIIGWNK